MKVKQKKHPENILVISFEMKLWSFCVLTKCPRTIRCPLSTVSTILFYLPNLNKNIFFIFWPIT